MARPVKPKVFVENQYGVEIEKCCANCVFHRYIEMARARLRICVNNKSGQKVQRGDCCDAWSISFLANSKKK
jgi:hypothetical protein